MSAKVIEPWVTEVHRDTRAGVSIHDALRSHATPEWIEEASQ